jgi:aspartate/methionine/tyrosine aminotransferase
LDFLNVGGRSWEELALAKNLIHMGHNCNHLEIHEAIHAAMIRAIEADDYRNYAPPYGFGELRELIKKDLNIPGAEVVVTQGATEAIYQAMASILEPGDETIVTDPGWPHIGNFARMLKSTVVDVPIYSSNVNYKLQPDLLRTYLTDRTRLISIIDPLNPLGSAYSEEEIRALCELASSRGIWLLHDATYRDFSHQGHFSAVRYYERAVMNISLSKICGFAGLRIGASVAHPKAMAKILDYQVGRLGGNWVAQQGAIAAYQTKTDWCARLVQTNRRNQDVIQAAIDKIPGLQTVVRPSSGNFIAVDVVGTGGDSEDIVRALLDVGFVVRSGAYTSPRFGNRFVRITTSIPAIEVDQFCTALPKTVGNVKQIAWAR